VKSKIPFQSKRNIHQLKKKKMREKEKERNKEREREREKVIINARK